MQEQILQLQKENATIEQKIKEQYQTFVEEREKLRARNKALRYALYQEQAKNKAAVEQFSAKIQSLEEKIASKQQYLRFSSPTTKPIYTSDRSTRFKEIQERGRMLEQKADEILMKCRSSDPRAFMNYNEQSFGFNSPPDYNNVFSNLNSHKSSNNNKKRHHQTTRSNKVIQDKPNKTTSIPQPISTQEEESTTDYFEPSQNSQHISDKSDEYSSTTQPENDESDHQIPMNTSGQIKRSSSASSNKSLTKQTKEHTSDSKPQKQNVEKTPFDNLLDETSDIATHNQQKQQSKESSQNILQTTEEKPKDNTAKTDTSSKKLQKGPATMSNDDPFASSGNIDLSFTPNVDDPETPMVHENSPVATQQAFSSDILSDPFNSTGGFTDKPPVQSNSHLTEDILPNPVPEKVPFEETPVQNISQPSNNVNHQNDSFDDSFEIPDFDFQ